MRRGGMMMMIAGMMIAPISQTAAFVLPHPRQSIPILDKVICSTSYALSRQSRSIKMSLLVDPITEVDDFLRTVAGVDPPKDLPALIQLLNYRGEESVSPSDRLELHPLVVPLTRTLEGEFTCLLRWPTPQENAPIPVVRTKPCLSGLRLVALCTLDLAHRFAAEEDAAQGREADWAASLVNQHLPEDKKYVRGAVDEVGHGIERFLFLKVGGFPDVYEFLTQYHLGREDEQSALVTSEKAYNSFNGWGQPYMYYCKLLRSMKGRELESRDAALAALRTPLWTIALEAEDLDIVLEAAKSSRTKAQDKFWKLYTDERLQEIKQGKRPEQVSLDRAAFLMDAALLGANGITSWSEIREPLAKLYEDARMTELATFVKGP